MPLHRRSRRTGLSLVELLLVIFLGVTLLGLVGCGLHQARTAAARTTTAGMICQIVTAVHNAHDTYKGFPPYWGTYPSAAVKHPSVRPGQVSARSLFFHILPFIDGVTLYNNLGNLQGATPPAFPPYMCPLDPTTGDGTNGQGQGVTSFLVNQRAFCADSTAPLPSTYSAIPASFPAGLGNCVFVVTSVGVPADPTAHVWTGSAVWFADTNGSSLPLPAPARPANAVAQQPYELDGGNGAMVGMGDASTRTVAPTVPAAMWALVCNPRSVDPIPADWDQR
jgi:hypothetical protein